MKQYYVYLTTNRLNNKKYIGQHFGELTDSYLGSGVLLAKAIKTYGKENFYKEILEICQNQNQLDEAEKKWITFYNAVNDKMFYNLAEGPTQGNSYIFCQQYWQQHPEEFQANIQKWKNAGQQYWIDHPEEQKKSVQKMLAAAEKYRVNNPDAVLEHMVKLNAAKEEWQRNHPEEHAKQVAAWREAGSIANSKAVQCITTGETFNSISEAARTYGIPQGNISQCLKGTRKSAGKHPITQEKLYWKFCK